MKNQRQRRKKAQLRASALFGASTDRIVFIDDWKGSESNKPDSPVGFVGIVFYREHLHRLGELLDELEMAKAESWHATDRNSLFTARNAEAIKTRFQKTRSYIFDVEPSVAELTSPAIEEQHTRQPAGAFPREAGTNAYCRGLWHFCSCVVGNMRDRECRPLNVRFYSDWQDWLSASSQVESSGRTFSLDAVVASDCSAELLALPGTSTNLDALRLINLADADSWALGRLKTRRLPDGRQVRTAFRAQEYPPSEELMEATDSLDPAVHSYLKQFFLGWRAGRPRRRDNTVDNYQRLRE